MNIYTDKNTNIVEGLERHELNIETHAPTENQNIITVHDFPIFWGVGAYTYNNGEYSLTDEGRRLMVEEYGVSPEIHFSDPRIEPKTIAKLWNACSEYQNQRLDASGLVGMTFKAQQGGAKALANVQWVQSLWAVYYVRKALVKADPEAVVSLEFTEAGNLPYDYAEAFNE